jgi:hypothetical protein
VRSTFQCLAELFIGYQNYVKDPQASYWLNPLRKSLAQLYFFPDLSTYYRKLYTITSASIVSCSNEVLIGQRQLMPTLVSNAFRYNNGKTFINGKIMVKHL